MDSDSPKELNGMVSIKFVLIALGFSVPLYTSMLLGGSAIYWNFKAVEQKQFTDRVELEEQIRVLAHKLKAQTGRNQAAIELVKDDVVELKRPDSDHKTE